MATGTSTLAELLASTSSVETLAPQTSQRSTTATQAANVVSLEPNLGAAIGTGGKTSFARAKTQHMKRSPGKVTRTSLHPAFSKINL